MKKMYKLALRTQWNSIIVASLSKEPVKPYINNLCELISNASKEKINFTDEEIIELRSEAYRELGINIKLIPYINEDIAKGIKNGRN